MARLLRLRTESLRQVPAKDATVLAFPKIRDTSAGSPVADRMFRYAMLACALSILAIVGLILAELVMQSQLSLHTFGWKFLGRQIWDPVAGDFGALPFIYGTLVSSLVALVVAVPLA